MHQEKLTEKFEEIYEEGTKAVEELEILKAKHAKELRRRSQNFRDLVSNRNEGIRVGFVFMRTFDGILLVYSAKDMLIF